VTTNSEPTTALQLGDARTILGMMPDTSADCILTSPPSLATRDYGAAEGYGHEPSPAASGETPRSVFREARRVLADDGTCWLNLGDSSSEDSRSATDPHADPGPALADRRAQNIAANNLLGLPWRVTFALQDDGWILRNAIVWHTPNAMPEWVRDWMNCRYELVFLLATLTSHAGRR
jgi:site-specific DNA-methyltransferase (cytosine-N4-specific)